MEINKRFNGKCKGCGLKVSMFVASIASVGKIGSVLDEHGTEMTGTWDNGVIRYPHKCETHVRITLRPVQGKYSAEHVCNSKCMASLGHDCECSCGGKNHGASWDNAA
jgi:hypothetical protein